ncbi:MAG: response regulator [Planctomycetes bacterium]|nr:response regulator [Planctomycetota bacterium]
MNAPATLVLLIEDDPPIRRFLRTTLTVQGYELVEATTAKEGLLQATSRNPDVVLVDLGLPDGDGIDVIKRIREWSQVPVIILSARGAENDKVNGLDAGADDYLTKPFSVGELMARMRVALRRRERRGSESAIVTVGTLSVDLTKRLVTVGEREVHLTPIEYKLLTTLMRNAGKVMTHEQLLKEAWGPSYGEEGHYLRIYIHQLRQKIEVDPARPRYLVTEVGVGYRLRDE